MKLIAHSSRLGLVFIGVGATVYALSHSSTATDSVRSFTSDKVTSSSIYAITIDQVNQKYLIVAYENKSLLCWDIESGELLGSRQMRKKPTAVLATTWTPPTPQKLSAYDVAIVSDKAGEIWAVRVPDLAQEVLVAGHTTSVVTELTFSTDLTKIISCDRDEKLRISSFPDLETIHEYCLGHTSVVSSACSLENDLLVSTGWDHRLFLWSLSSADILDEIAFKDVPPPSSSTGPSAAANKRSREEGGEQKEAAEGEEGEQDKEYNEQEAGNYPFKLASNHKSTFAVIFKDDVHLKVYQSKDAKIQLLHDIVLSHPPLDVAFVNEHTVSVLLPKPDILQYYNIHSSTSDNTTAAHLASSQHNALQALVGDDFTQAVVSAGLGFDNETGMKKHSLDRPFNKDEDINFNAKKGAKRSKKT